MEPSVTKSGDTKSRCKFKWWVCAYAPRRYHLEQVLCFSPLPELCEEALLNLVNENVVRKRKLTLKVGL